MYVLEYPQIYLRYNHFRHFKRRAMSPEEGKRLRDLLTHPARSPSHLSTCPTAATLPPPPSTQRFLQWRP